MTRDTVQLSSLLERVIDREARNVDFYLDLASRADRSATEMYLVMNANENLRNKELLSKLDYDERLSDDDSISKEEFERITRIIESENSSEDSEPSATLHDAMNMEKDSFRLYSCLTANSKDTVSRETFEKLAGISAIRRSRFEMEYEDRI